ncbi:MAG: sensor histidine kinase, partial [Bacteroidota bacterium]
MEEMRKNENQRGIMSVLNQLGRLYQKGAAYGTSDSILLVAAKVAKQVDDQNLLLENYDFRRQLYRHVKDYSMAVFTDMKYDSLQEEIFRNERIKVQQIQADYDLSLANERARIAEQEKETERRNAEVTLTFSIALGLLFFVVLITSYFLYRSRQKLSAVNSDLHAKNQKIALLNKQNLHFTKNSLAEIVSLLSIQSTRTNNGAAQNVLRTGRLRVETVNLLYRLLFLNHSNQNNQLIRMDDYLSEIVLNTLDSMLGPDIEIKHDLDIEPIEIEHEDALQIGLIVNEICINSCKYAFSNCDSGVFKVQLTTESKCYQLVIGDNGQGLPDDFNEGSVNGFGVQLITALAHDLNAKFDVVSAKSGLNYYFHIPIMTLKDELQDINS